MAAMRSMAGLGRGRLLTKTSKHMAYTDEVLQTAHVHCARHEPEIKRSQNCGCFYCKATFPSAEIEDWVDDEPRSALGPRCMIDSVVGDASGFDVTDAGFLEAMHEYWFERTIPAAKVGSYWRKQRRGAVASVLAWLGGRKSAP